MTRKGPGRENSDQEAGPGMAQGSREAGEPWGRSSQSRGKRGGVHSISRCRDRVENCPLGTENGHRQACWSSFPGRRRWGGQELEELRGRRGSRAGGEPTFPQLGCEGEGGEQVEVAEGSV